MPVGVILRDEYGNVILDYTTRVGKFIGQHTTNGSQSGSFVDTRLIGASFIYFSQKPSGEFGGVRAHLDADTGTVYWEYICAVSGRPLPTPTIDTIYYGYY